MPKGKIFIYPNGEVRCHTNKKITVVRFQNEINNDAFQIECLNYDPQYADKPCVASISLRGKIRADTIGLTKLSAASMTVSIMRLLGAYTIDELLQIEYEEALKHENAQEILIQQRKNKKL